MGLYCLTLLKMALELAKQIPPYEDIASKFFEHFLYIADAMNHIGRNRIPLWDEASSFYYNVLHLPDRQSLHLKVRSMLGIIPLFATEVIELEVTEAYRCDLLLFHEYFHGDNGAGLRANHQTG